MILLPLNFFLIVKIFHGIMWWKTPGRISYVRYYLVSAVYYLSLTVEFLLVLFTSEDILSTGATILGWILVLLTLPFLILLQMYMTFIDENHFKVNRFTNVI